VEKPERIAAEHRVAFEIRTRLEMYEARSLGTTATHCWSQRGQCRLRGHRFSSSWRTAFDLWSAL